MARDTDQLAGFETDNTGGVLSGFLAEEDEFDHRSLWRLGSWGVASVGAVIVAILASQSSIGARREQLAAADLARQSQQIQSVAKESQDEARRLASAIDTLNGDRDRLYSRVTVLEQGLDSMTGAITRQNPAVASPQAATTALAPTGPQATVQNPAPPVVAPAITTVAKTAEKPKTDMAVAEQAPATVSSVGLGASNKPTEAPSAPLMASKSMMAPPDAAAGRLIEPEKPLDAAPAAPAPEVVASVSPLEPDTSEADDPKVDVLRTEFAVDVGGANSIGGLRALWRGLLKSNEPLAALRPIIVVRERRTGLGMQLRLAAGPLSDAAAAAKICASLIENKRTCETTVFDGQRLAMKTDEPAATAKPAAAVPKPVSHRRSASRRAAIEDQPKKPEPSTLSRFFGTR